MIAIISDIHANYEALQAVLDQIETFKPDSVICLGDIVGYGPDPVACVDAVRERCDMTLCGNHDFALVYGANFFTPVARQSIERHRRMIMPRFRKDADDEERRERWDYLKGLPHRRARDSLLFVHAAPRNPVVEYLRKMDVLLGMSEKINENFKQVDWLCFIGHTHQPGVITWEMKFYEPEEIDNTFRPQPHRKAIVNVGSVGQSRDGDWRACFVTVEEDGLVRYHRVEYDVERAAAKINAVGGMDETLAERLRRGR
ncbi:MAG: metallophosphoesterase family protein [Planctomycetota bacterium]